jgi:hypothetical protein
MADLERVKQAPLRSVLTAQEHGLRRSLSSEDSSILLAEMDALTRRYPSQDIAESIETYLADLEQLALRYSVTRVQSALAELRITPGQKFFPRPDEVAEMIERQREAGVQEARRRDGDAWMRDWKAHVERVNAERATPEYQAWLSSLGGPDGKEEEGATRGTEAG